MNKQSGTPTDRNGGRDEHTSKEETRRKIKKEEKGTLHMVCVAFCSLLSSLGGEGAEQQKAAEIEERGKTAHRRRKRAGKEGETSRRR